MTNYAYTRHYCWDPPLDLVRHWWRNCGNGVLACQWCFIGEMQEAPFDNYAGRSFVPAEEGAKPGDFGLQSITHGPNEGTMFDGLMGPGS